MNQDGIWLTILEYATAKSTSISTIRRAIKSGHIKYREDSGKYYIWSKEIKSNSSILSSDLTQKIELESLKKKNRDLQEEINDLKMLLNVYENQNNLELPSVPEMDV